MAKHFYEEEEPKRLRNGVGKKKRNNGFLQMFCRIGGHVSKKKSPSVDAGHAISSDSEFSIALPLSLGSLPH